MDRTDSRPEPWRALYPFAPHHVAVNGGNMHYVDCGAGDPVVMVHGNPTWSFMYREAARELSARHRVVIPDHIGCGLSDKPQTWGYRLRDHVANLEALVDRHLRLERFDLMVHDWGGAIGMGYAVRHPERIGRLVVLNTAAFLLPHCPWRIRICRWPVLGPAAVRGLNAFARAAVFMAVARGKRLPPQVRAGFLHPYASWRDRIAILRFVEDIPLRPSHPTWADIAAIQDRLQVLADKPVLICWGAQDFCFDDRFLARWRQEFPAAAVHRFADAGHYVLEDAGDRIVPLVSSFLG